MTAHIRRAVNVLRRRLGDLTPRRRPSRRLPRTVNGTGHTGDVRLEMSRRAFLAGAAAAAAEIIEQAHCPTIPYPFSRPLDAAGESS